MDHATGEGPDLAFGYGASGQRIMKQVGQPGTDAGAYREHYIRDAQGNIMATYRYTNATAASLELNERPIYGSSRLGSYAKTMQLYNAQAITSNPPPSNIIQRPHLRYELTDHLGNVAAVVTGRLLPSQSLAPFEADLVSAQGYEPFGSLLPGRNYSSSNYNYGFQGQIKDDEINGSVGTSYAFEYRMHDPRVGRFLSIDPLASEYPWNSPYAFSENKPIEFIELEGLQVSSPAPRGAPRVVMTRYQRLEVLRQIRQSRADAAYRERMRSESEHIFRLKNENPAEYYRYVQGLVRNSNARDAVGKIALSISRSSQIKRDVESLRTEQAGTTNEVRSGEVLGEQVTINSGHGYNQGHRHGGGFSGTNLTRDQIETAIMSDLLNQPRSSVPEARKGPVNPLSRNITVEGVEINYKAVRTETGLSVGTYSPVPPKAPAQQEVTPITF